MIKEKQCTVENIKEYGIYPDYNVGVSTKCIQRKQEKFRMQVYWLAFYSVELHARSRVYMTPDFSALPFEYLSNNVSETVAPTLICKFKTWCTITTVLGLICILQRNEKTSQPLYRNLSYTSTNIDKAHTVVN